LARTHTVIEELAPPIESEKPAESTEGTDSQQPKLSSIGFFEQLSRFSNVDWEQHIVYVYRLSPITDRLAGGTTKYLMKYGSRFDQDTLKADHGSGRYRLQLNRYGDKGQSKTIRTYEIDIEDINFPPKVPPGEWLDDPRNKRWAWAKAKIQPTPDAPGADPWTPERITRMVKELRPDAQPQDQMSITKAVLDAVKETRAELGAASNPASMMTMLKELILLAKPETTAKPEAESQTFTLLMRMLDAAEKRATQALEEAKADRLRAEEDRKRAHELEMAERKHQHELELERLKQKADAASPIAMVKEVLELQREVGQLGGGEPRNWKEKLVDEGLQYVPQLLDVAGKAFGGAYRRAQPGQQTQQPGAQPQPTAQQQPPPNPQQQPHQPAASQTGADPMPAQPADPEIAFLLPIFESQGGRFVQAFAQDPNMGGHHVAKDVIFYGGAATYERIARMGREKILATIALIPPMQTDLLKVGTQEMLNDFVDQFVEGPEPDDDDDDEPPIPEANGKPRKKEKTIAQ